MPSNFQLESLTWFRSYACFILYSRMGKNQPLIFPHVEGCNWVLGLAQILVVKRVIKEVRTLLLLPTTLPNPYIYAHTRFE